jgi:hypothetical protein
MRACLIAVSAIPGTLVKRQNVGVAKTPTGVIRFGTPGEGDIAVVYQGRAIEIEVKTETGRQSAQQRAYQAAFERAGGKYVVVRSVDEAVCAVREID